MKYNFLLFDLDNTLVDLQENTRYAFKETIKFLRKEYSDDYFDKWVSFDNNFWNDFYNKKINIPEEYNATKELFVKYVRSIRFEMFFYGDINLETAFEINDLYIDALKEIVIPIIGSYETLKYLSSKYKIIIATNGASSAASIKLEKIGCLDFISYIFSADMTNKTVTKPSKEYFEELFETVEIKDKSKVLMVGDSLDTDIKGAMNSNIDSCWFNRNNDILLEEYKPTIVVNSLDELISKL